MIKCDLPTLLDALSSDDVDQQIRTLDACFAVLADPTLWYWLIGFTVVSGVVGALIGWYKNAVVRDTLLGLALGPIGWGISLLLSAPKPKRACAACGRQVDADDRHCRDCGAPLRG